jgi:hypothetical protein
VKPHRIEHYWTTWAKVDQSYRDLGEIATDLFRYGIAHSYPSRPGVAILRGDRAAHLRLTDYGVTLECVQLYEDFQRAWARFAKPYIVTTPPTRNGASTSSSARSRQAKLVDDLPSERWSRTDLTTAPTFVCGMSATPIHLRDPR